MHAQYQDNAQKKQNKEEENGKKEMWRRPVNPNSKDIKARDHGRFGRLDGKPVDEKMKKMKKKKIIEANKSTVKKKRIKIRE